MPHEHEQPPKCGKLCRIGDLRFVQSIYFAFSKTTKQEIVNHNHNQDNNNNHPYCRGVKIHPLSISMIGHFLHMDDREWVLWLYSWLY